MKAEDLAYIAGFFDGEGCATILHGGGANRNCIQKRVSICNTNRDILLQIQRILGFGSLYEKKRDNKKHKTLYDLVFLQDQIPVFLALILPYVRLKKRQVEILLEYSMGHPDAFNMEVELTVLNMKGK